MADLEFFFDPICPWAWITSRWVNEVQNSRSYDVTWRFISLRMINEDLGYTESTEVHRQSHFVGTQIMRAAALARAEDGNEAVGKLYTAVGTALHNNKQHDEMMNNPTFFLVDALSRANLNVDWAKGADNEEFDAVIREETDLAFSRTGKGVGTPILTFKPGQANEGSFFGPVISEIPRGDAALKLWDAIELIATSTGMAELKRSIRSAPNFN
jgi:2-hydroxychromene-2-carboxylate isomerase